MKISKTKKLILSASLLALALVLLRFLSIKTPLLSISFGFVPIMIAAILLGPTYSTMIAALADFIGAILFPFGTYFPGFTISAAITGCIYGIFLYRKPGKEIGSKSFLLRLILSNLIVLGVVEIFLVSLWLHIMYGKAYLVIVSTRIIAQLIMFPIRIITIFVLDKVLHPIFHRYLEEKEEE